MDDERYSPEEQPQEEHPLEKRPLNARPPEELRRAFLLLQLALLICIGSLFATLGLQRFFVDPIPALSTNLIVFVLQTAPLIAAAIAILRLTKRCAFWSAMVSLVYFIHGVMLLFSIDGRLLGGWETFFALAMFTLSFPLARLIQLAERDRQ